MASTTELIDAMTMTAPDWNREGNKGLLTILNHAQNILYNQESFQTQAFRTDDELPYIATTDETYQYTLNQATTGLSVDIWRVAEVLLSYPFSTQIQDVFISEYGIIPNLQQPIQILEFHGEAYYRFHQVSCTDSLRDGHPLLQFSINPGATTTDFHLLAYKKATQLTTENIEPSIPENLHFNCLLPTAIKLLEAYQTHNWIEALEMIDQKFKPMFVEQMNNAAQGESHSVTRHEE